MTIYVSNMYVNEKWLARAFALFGPIVIKCSIIISDEILGNVFVCDGNMYLHIQKDGLEPEYES